VELIVKGTPPELPEPRIRALAEAVTAAEGQTLTHLSVSFVDPAAIAELNHRHRGRAQPTDVLSWAYDGAFPHGPGGEIVLCPEAAGTDLAALFVHGLLHVLGYDDVTERGARRMDRRAAAVLEHEGAGG
jgi:probable rRNA maturation factor